VSAARDPAPLARWRVRPMGVRDTQQVADIEARVYPFPWTRGNFVDSLKAGHDAWVFELPDAMIGYAIVMWLPDEVHLLNLSVATAHQGRGHGRSMLQWLCDDAARRGAGSMLLEVRPSNEQARLLYDSMGFRQLGVRKRYYPSHDDTREDALVLVRSIR
jgi:ribosomal-protein-alanine N-acetyltransferase